MPGFSDTSSPHITDWQGVSDNYEPFTFNVPEGQDRLNVAAAFQNAGNGLTDPAPHARVRITLIDPAGRLAEYSVPQGDGTYGDVQITEPIPGRWTAYIYSRNSNAGGTTGAVVVGASSARYTSFGSVSPSSVRLAPGQSAPVRLTVSTPSSPGDAAGSILMSSGGRAQSTIAVTLRSLIPAGDAVFNGVATGGNGREFQAGQMFTYQLDLQAGRPELNATVISRTPRTTCSTSGWSARLARRGRSPRTRSRSRARRPTSSGPSSTCSHRRREPGR
jgi:hypothetical protein